MSSSEVICSVFDRRSLIAASYSACAAAVALRPFFSSAVRFTRSFRVSFPSPVLPAALPRPLGLGMSGAGFLASRPLEPRSAPLNLMASVSRLCTARSISLTRRSFSPCRVRLRRFMRWISFSMACTSPSPTLGSNAAWVSFSSWIFFSHSSSCRSASMISSSTSSFFSVAALILRSISRLCSSRPLSWLTKSSSKTPFASVNSPSLSPFFPMSSFRRDMSVCSAAAAPLKRLISASAIAVALTVRSRFSDRMATRARSSLLASATSSVSELASTRAVWSRSQSLCSATDSSARSAISFLRALIVASRGPRSSPSPPPAALCDSRSFSYLRFKVSTFSIFFSISSLRCRISSWYFSTSLSLSVRFPTALSRRSRSWVLWAWVLSESTLILLSSLSTPAISTSFSCSFPRSSLRLFP
mmetsp:Transcript_65023/g.146698  ORF Transcript_65023/g.146698 Transcript_65023/m.146698 type:complete len:416 (-) Transcript_65023:1172-2419(-)